MIGKTDGVELVQVFAQNWGRHDAFSGFHPVVVALDGVDLSIVRHIAVGVSQGPLGEGVGRETLVHETQGGDASRILQVQKVSAHLIGQEQALVDHGARGHAWDVVFFAVL